MNATRTFRPSASSPPSVAAPSASTSPFFTRSPGFTIARWLMQVSWLVRKNFVSWYSTRRLSSNEMSASVLFSSMSYFTTIRSASTYVHDAVPLGDDQRAGVAGDLLLQAGADERRLRPEQRHRLALHVRAHQGAVGVVVLEERDQGGGRADDLVRRDVHVLHLVRLHDREVALEAGLDAVALEVAPRVERRVRLRDRVIVLLLGRQELDLVRAPGRSSPCGTASR